MREPNFFDKVCDIVSQIPEGKVATYGRVAFLAGSPRASRIVGYALRLAPDERALPCHRVVDREGRMAPGHVFGSQALQRSMLEKEGVVFMPDGRIDMKKHLWTFDGYRAGGQRAAEGEG